MSNDAQIKKERIATSCVCCGNPELNKSPAVLMPFVAHRVFGWQPTQIDATWGLNTIQQGMAYSLCNSSYCTSCDFLFLDIRFSDDELAALYDDYRGESYTALRDKYEPGYKQRNDDLVSGVDYLPQVESFLTPHLNFPINLLDWGGDTGLNSPFKNAGALHIYDINNKSVIDGAKIVNKNQLSETNYHLIVCSNVLEHVSYPRELLQEIKVVMGKDTLLYIEVPYEAVMRQDSDRETRHMKKRHWHEHVNFYSECSLQKLLSSVDLAVIDSNQLEVCHKDGDTAHYLQLICRLA